MAREYAVYGIGNAIMDLQVKVGEEDFSELGLAKAGMQLVTTSEQQHLLKRVDAHEMNQASGGSAANTIISMAQLGSNVSYGCLVGDDSLGQFYYREMAELGVTLHNLPLPGKSTGTCVILITPDAERTMNTNLGVSSEFSALHVSDVVIKKSDWLYIEGYLLASEEGRSAAVKAVEWATKYNTKIAVTFSDTFIVKAFGDALREVVDAATLIFANASEAAAFTEETNERNVFESLKLSAPNVVMTLSEQGALVSVPGEEFHVPAFKTKALDLTGAGDAFAGAFLYGITTGRGAEESAYLGCYLASKVVSQIGPRLMGDVRTLLSTAEYEDFVP